jgi:hypothetical protein
MNLKDYQKIAESMFEGGHELDLFLEQVWDSGVRSGAASAATRKKSCLYVDWVWPDNVYQELIDYVVTHAPVEVTRVEAWPFIQDEMEAMALWAASKGERKVDWNSALKGWMRRTWGSSTLPTTGDSLNPQASLFGDSSTKRLSGSSRVEAEQAETYRKAIEMNSRREPPSRWNTSQPTAKAVMQRGSPSSSRIPPQSH